MRQPLKSKGGQRGNVSRVVAYPAPVGGWNARDALAEMPPTDAVTLENWFPGTSYCEIRGGNSSHATGTTGNVKTLAVYNALSGTNTMWAYTASGIYNVSSAGAVGASVLARTNGKHQWVNFGDGTNNYLIACNGVDKPAYYDGTTWTAVDNVTSPALTGVTTTTLISPFVSKGRLYFIQVSTLSFWYLAAGAAGGALTEFDLSAVAKKGGYLMAGATWTVDGGDGPDDRVVFVTSEGEVIVYAGTNPSSAASWALVGVYEISKPLGRRCLAKYGGDLVLITQTGTFPLATALQSAAIDYKLALSFKIEKAFTEAALTYGSVFGWEVTIYPAKSALIVNIPKAEDGEHEQYVMNTITQSWCKFKEWDAETFVVYNGQLYFATGTAVYKAWTGMVDVSSNIVAYGKTAFSYFGSIGQVKKFHMYQPVLATNGSLTFQSDMDVDFNEAAISGTATYSVSSGGVWGTSLWGSGLWAYSLEVIKQWTSPARNVGFAGAGKIQISTNTLTIQWIANNYMFETGGMVG